MEKIQIKLEKDASDGEFSNNFMHNERRAHSSDSSTVAGSMIDSDNPPDEAFTYLQGLNSGNLMQFSQQSALQELMNEHGIKSQVDLTALKSHMDILPNFEDHDIGGYNFDLKVSIPRRGKSACTYSETLKKIFIRMNDICNVEASYQPKYPKEKLRIRIMLCFTKQVSEPVLRCQNHLSVDQEEDVIKRQSLLRCENPDAEYVGAKDGKNIKDRLSVLLAANRGPQSVNKQTIALKFACQNSCIGRKETTLVFLLENLKGEPLAQRVFDVKICSCPRRDMKQDERNAPGLEVKKEEDCSPKKRMRHTSTKSDGGGGSSKSYKLEHTDTEPDDSYSSDSFAFHNSDVRPISGGGFRVVLHLPNKESALQTVNYALGYLTSEIYMNPLKAPINSEKCNRLKRTYDTLSKF